LVERERERERKIVKELAEREREWEGGRERRREGERERKIVKQLMQIVKQLLQREMTCGQDSLR